jgi:nucleoside-diphosphate-sugar epimerase
VASGGEGLSRLIRRPPLLTRFQLEFLLWEPRVDNTKACRDLGMEFTPWEEGVRRTVRWMQSEGRV